MRKNQNCLFVLILESIFSKKTMQGEIVINLELYEKQKLKLSKYTLICL